MKRAMAFAAALFAAMGVYADVPQLINYQGRLINGTNLVNGSVGLSLRLYNASGGGNLLYEDSNSVTVVDGLYSTFIGDNTTSGSLAGALTNAEVWIEVAVNGTLLSPRERLASVGYAVTAGNVANGAITTAMLADGAVTGVKLATNSVGASNLIAGAVTENALAAGAVTGGKIAANAITSAHVADGSLNAQDFGTEGRMEYTYIPNPTPAEEEGFGLSVAGVGLNSFVVGAPEDDSHLGSVYVYGLSGTLMLKITNPVVEFGSFGYSVAGIGSNRFVVGAYLGNYNVGAAYLYDLNGTRLATITNPTPETYEYFGNAVAGIGSNRFVVGAPNDDTGAPNAGSVYLYDSDGTFRATITNPAPATYKYFGNAVAGIGSNRFLVGAPLDSAVESNGGCAYMYDLDGTLLATITNPTPKNGDGFGWSVAGVGSDRFLIGAFGDDSGASDAGSAYLYDLNWKLLATITNPAPGIEDYFGISVAGVGSNLLVGARADDAGAADAGSVYLYDPNGALLATIANPAPEIGDYFGFSVTAVGANRFLVGAPTDDIGATDAGSVYLYDLASVPVVTGLTAETAWTAYTASHVADGAVGSAQLASNISVSGRVVADSLQGNGAVPWVVVADTAATAVPNTGYLANNALPVAITLPASPAIGSIVRVAGMGAGGWHVVQNDGQQILTRTIGGLGATWSAHATTSWWQSIASSADGGNLIAGDIYVNQSADFGNTWTNVSGLGGASSWALASSDDGTTLYAGVSGGFLYYSRNRGTNWAGASLGMLNFTGVACSSNGQKVVAAASGYGICVSQDFGLNWVSRLGGATWSCVASSSDGSILVAGTWGGQLYVSSDSGTNWTGRENGRNWAAVASSADGNRLVAVVTSGQIYTSTDRGVSWTAREGVRNWKSVCASADGSVLAATDGYWNGLIYVSTDAGVTWTACASNREWRGITCSRDGSRLAAVAYNGQIYTAMPATTPGTSGAVSGGPECAIELQYIGGGQFRVLSHEGAIVSQ